MKDFVPHKESLELKALGFDEPCFGYYENGVFIFWYDSRQESELLLNCSAPTFSQAFRFFREKYPDLDFGVGKIYNHKYHYHINLEWRFFQGSYEEAELELLKELIKYAKTN